jgi:hypothetical protein
MTINRDGFTEFQISPCLPAIGYLFSAFFIREFFTTTVVSPASIKKYLKMKIIISVGHSSLLTIFRVM